MRQTSANAIGRMAKLWMVVTALIPATVMAACNTSLPLTRPDSRYAVSTNTVTDAETGLIWQKCLLGLSGSSCGTGSANTYTWDAAFAAVQTANAGAGMSGHTDWRLPSVAELGSLSEKSCYAPAFNQTVFPGNPYGNYWSSTPYIYQNNYAWVVNFTNGADTTTLKTSQLYVRLVRGGQ